MKATAEADLQPIPFSHKRHSQVGMKCDVCHQKLETGEQLQIPGVAECMSCHQSIMKDSLAMQKLAQLEKESRPLSWTRLYRLPEFVFFSHPRHLSAKVDCEVCHGPVYGRDYLWQEKDISMGACVDCHKLRKASISCNICHDMGH